jgi:hypothetical protein
MRVDNKGLVPAIWYLPSLAPAVVLYPPPSSFNLSTHFDLAGMPEFNMSCEVSGKPPFNLRDRLLPVMSMPEGDPGIAAAVWGLTIPPGGSLTCNSTVEAFSSLKPCPPGDLVFVAGDVLAQPQISTLVVSAVEQLLVALDATKCTATAGKDSVVWPSAPTVDND